MFNIRLGINKSEPEKINKEIEWRESLNGELREQSNIMTPSILFNLDNPTRYNYAYIESFGRYYYITSIESVRNNLWRINMRVDVLMTYKNSILIQKAIIKKQENDFINKNFNDGTFKTTEEEVMEILEFPNNMGGDVNHPPIYLLTLTGSTVTAE